MKRFLILFFACLSIVACQTVELDPIGGKKIGLVMMHGKHGTPGRYVGQLASALESAGVIVVNRQMPWGRDRHYDKGYEAAMAEIDSLVEELKAKGGRTDRRCGPQSRWQRGGGLRRPS